MKILGAVAVFAVLAFAVAIRADEMGGVGAAGVAGAAGATGATGATGPTGLGTYTPVGAVSGGARRPTLWTVRLRGDAVFTAAIGSTANMSYFGNVPTAGPLADRNALNLTTQALIGFASIANTTADTETRPGWRPRLVADIRTGSAVTSERIWIAAETAGLNATAPSIASVASVITFVGVAYEDDISPNWLCCSGDGANMSCTNTTVQVTSNTNYSVSADWSVAGTLTCTVGGVATSKSSNLSTAAVDLGVEVAVTTLANVAATIYAAAIFMDQN